MRGLPCAACSAAARICPAHYSSRASGRQRLARAPRRQIFAVASLPRRAAGLSRTVRLPWSLAATAPPVPMGRLGMVVTMRQWRWSQSIQRVMGPAWPQKPQHCRYRRRRRPRPRRRQQRRRPRRHRHRQHRLRPSPRQRQRRPPPRSQGAASRRLAQRAVKLVYQMYATASSSTCTMTVLAKALTSRAAARRSLHT